MNNIDFSRYRVPISNICAIVVSLLICLSLIVVSTIIWKKKTKCRLSSMFIGMATFTLFALVLEQLVHLIVFKVTGDMITGNIGLYAIYGGLAAGIFEETGRFLAMKIVMKKYLDKKNAIMYGIGHGGVEAVLVTGMTMVSNLVIALILNIGQGNLLTIGMDSNTQFSLFQQLEPLWNSSPTIFIWGGLERIGAFFLHIGLSYIVYKGFSEKKIGYYFFAILIHAFIDAITVIMSGCGLPVYVIEAFLWIFSGCLMYFVVRNYKKQTDEKAFVIETKTEE